MGLGASARSGEGGDRLTYKLSYLGHWAREAPTGKVHLLSTFAENFDNFINAYLVPFVCQAVTWNVER